MPRRIIDTNRLVQSWHHYRRGRKPSEIDRMEVESWADQMSRDLGPLWILTPIEIEFLAAARTPEELLLFRAFLGKFRSADEGRILTEDWVEARRLACRTPRDGTPRQLGDCLIRAIARRLNCEVSTNDRRFPS
jgi:predicted nucleic acid-binding protein